MDKFLRFLEDNDLMWELRPLEKVTDDAKVGLVS